MKNPGNEVAGFPYVNLGNLKCLDFWRREFNIQKFIIKLSGADQP